MTGVLDEDFAPVAGQEWVGHVWAHDGAIKGWMWLLGPPQWASLQVSLAPRAVMP